LFLWLFCARKNFLSKKGKTIPRIRQKR
jgi:hypothetical protein